MFALSVFVETLLCCAALKDNEKYVLEVDLGAFRRGLPRMKRTKTIGQGVDFMNRHLSSSLSRDPAHGGINGSLFQYLKTFTYAGTCCCVTPLPYCGSGQKEPHV